MEIQFHFNVAIITQLILFVFPPFDNAIYLKHPARSNAYGVVVGWAVSSDSLPLRLVFRSSRFVILR